MLFSLVVSTAFAADISKQNVTDFLRELSELEEILQKHPECAELRDDAKPACAKLSDHFCATLWSDQNRGNMRVLDGELRTGRSQKSDYSLTQLADLEALANSGHRMPPDLLEKVAPILAQFKDTLREEADTDEWYRRVSRLQASFQSALDEVAENRAAARYPEAKAKKFEDRTTEEKVRMRMVEAEVRDQVLEAKYAQHPNWKRVEETFTGVQTAMLKMVDELPIPAELKNRLRTKVASVTLSLPYANPATVRAKETCGTTAVDAAYNPARNVFYVCAGMFNSLLSPSALAVIIAHELGHSIDINNLLYEDAQSLPVHAAFRPLVNSGGKTFSCEKWRNTLQLIKSKTYDVREPHNRRHPLDGLVSCFAGRSELQPFSLPAVTAAANQRTNKFFAINADAHFLIGLAQPTFRKFGTLRTNDKFMRPDLVLAEDLGAFDDGKSNREALVPELLAQALACQAGDRGVPYSEVSNEAERARLFQNALTEARLAFSAQLMETYLTCGETCPLLVKSGLSINVGENMADWYSIRTLAVLLRDKKERAERRQVALLGTSDLCREPGPENDSPEMALAEKRQSQEEHPNERLRRLSTFSPENAELLGCTVEKENAGFSQCMP